MQLASLPVENGETKAKLLGLGVDAAPSPKVKHFDTSIGVPIFWQERKTIACWKALLEDVQCRAIYDVTPGSGSCGRLALEMGYLYVALAKTQEHAAWLRAYLDRQTLRYMARPGCPMHNKDMLPAISTHFGALIQQLEAQGEAQGEDIDEDEEQEAE